MASSTPTYPAFDCAVYYPIVETGDYFQSETCGWYLGRKLGRNTVEFIDYSVHEDMPDDLTVVQLKSTITDSNTFHSINKEVIVSINDSGVKLGDVVCTFFQRGLNMEQPAWFRGRCASKDPSNNTIGVAYDDGEYEKNIPIAYSIRIVPVEANHNWLLGLRVTIPDKSNHKGTKHRADFGIVSAIEDSKITLQYSCEGEQWTKKKPSKSVIEGVLINCDQQAKALHNWPQTPQKRSKPPTIMTQRPPAGKKRKPLQSVSKPKGTKANATREMLDEASYGSGEENFAIQKSPKLARRATARQRAMKMAKSSLQENRTPAVPETHIEELPALSRREPTKKFVPMSFGESNAYLCALEGIDTGLASDWLHFLADHHAKLPNDDLWQRLLDMMSKGPRNGATKFPDKLKMTLTLEYVEMLINRHGLNLSKPLWDDGEDIGLTILEQIKSVLYGNKTFREATIHAKMCAARMLRYILEWALTDAVRERTVDSTKIMKGLSFKLSPKIYLEAAVDALASFHGEAVDEQGFIFELRQDLTTCVSFFAWWYGVAAHEDADALADLISQRHPADMGLINKLNRSLLPQVRPKVAERWGIADQYNIIYG